MNSKTSCLLAERVKGTPAPKLKFLSLKFLCEFSMNMLKIWYIFSTSQSHYKFVASSRYILLLEAQHEKKAEGRNGESHGVHDAWCSPFPFFVCAVFSTTPQLRTGP